MPHPQGVSVEHGDKGQCPNKTENISIVHVYETFSFFFLKKKKFKKQGLNEENTMKKTTKYPSLLI